MAEEFYYVDKETYEDKSLDDYVHPNAQVVAQGIVDEWKKPNCERMILLKAQMQSGNIFYSF